ncbi:MAG: carboxylating nicotinate-nucleotide diphosphorylase [Bdellovibrionales bacterium]|nr:carboxylating nicotinate-nucleotide diphosphorylase [Bdellovibrionales bacterium]
METWDFLQDFVNQWCMQDYHEHSAFWKHSLEEGLKEDGWPWDWTARGSVRQGQIKARVVAKSSGIWVGQALASAVTKIVGQPLIRETLPDGSPVSAGSIVAQWEGPAHWVLALERPALNLAAFASGIATQTSRLVDIVRSSGMKNPPRVTCTRKTLPGYRDLSIASVIAGGGHPHRVSLSGGVLIKENHIASAGGIIAAVRGARAVAPHGLRVEIEVRNLVELSQALDAGVEAVLLDNFTPALVTDAIRAISLHQNSKVIVEVSGGISESNIKAYVQEGVHVISVGSLTHSVKPLDLSLLVQGA